ncbi:hypothetical protein G7Z17_g7216 [Cylindrodendrum hubeiense]|uniref:Uncharacterized protein n=1 Tax=Cylindrodendrum hubeiense TaxID=595255 RepID=A0A9P5H5X6_9HYPO|nr:hypothetical protein G7Z17_g7216 [Cylindrodendrum hubeiense]
MSPSTVEPEIIPMKSRVIHKFYEPLVLLSALNSATRETAVPVNVMASIDADDDKEVFQAFVYKLGHVCDRVKGDYGATITSFYVLQDQNNEDQVHYWFASNQRTHEELEYTKAHVEGLLNKVKNASGDTSRQRSVFKALLSDVLIFNRPRVGYYISKMMEHATKCISMCLDIPDEKEPMIGEILEVLVDLIDFDTSANTSDQVFAERCHQIIIMLERLPLSPSGRAIAERAAEGRMPGVPSEECWSDLQHMINRTVAYAQSVRFMLKAKSNWPKLFKHFDVSYYESSARMPRPFRNKSQTAEGIVGRMTRKTETMTTFRAFVLHLQMFDLDKLIQTEYRRESFRPIVHSEVLLLDQLDKKGLLEKRFFFNGWMYIGSSKPTCKLCDHFFEKYPAKIGRRPTHGNMYLSWRFPDVLKSQGDEGVQKRHDMLERVLQKVREEAFDIVKMKSPSSYRRDDSFTNSAALPPDRAGDVDDLASLLGQVDLD